MSKIKPSKIQSSLNTLKSNFSVPTLKKGYQVRRTLIKSRGGFQRIIKGPSHNALVSACRMRAFDGALGVTSVKKISKTPMKVIGIRT